MSKRFKNTTGTLIELFELGDLELPTGGVYVELTIEEYLDVAADEAISELTPLINAGDVIVNDGTNDLSAADGIRFLRYADRAYIQSYGVDVTRVNVDLNFEDNLTVTDNGNGKATVKGMNEGEGTDERLIHVKCVPGKNCVMGASMLLDSTLCFIKKGAC